MKSGFKFSGIVVTKGEGGKKRMLRQWAEEGSTVWCWRVNGLYFSRWTGAHIDRLTRELKGSRYSLDLDSIREVGNK